MARQAARTASVTGVGAQRRDPGRARYIADMAGQLAVLAEQDGLTMAAYFLRLAQLDARAQDTDGQAPSRD